MLVCPEDEAQFGCNIPFDFPSSRSARSVSAQGGNHITYDTLTPCRK